MNILIIQEAGRRPKNKNFRECENLSRALISLGHHVDLFGRGYPTPTPDYDSYDVVLLLENYFFDFVPSLAKTKALTLFWTIDSHMGVNKHISVAKNNNIDIVLHSTRGYISHYERAGIQNNHWFPNAYPSDLYPVDIGSFEMYNTRPNGVGFCGNYANRKSWIDKIDTHFGIKRDIMAIGQDMIDAIRSYKIHFNRNIKDDINYRTFETLGAGTLTLTNYTDGLEELFNIGEELVVYRSEEDCLEKIKYYLDNPAEIYYIVERGHYKVMSEHTYFNRAQQLIDIVEEF